MRWLKFRDYRGFWIDIRADCIVSLSPISPNGFVMKTLAGSTELLTKREANRVIRKLVRLGMKP